MTAVRQDAWTPDDDLILAEVTLRQIREGGTQLKAFEEVGERIGRTAAACGFRWNSCVRKKYEAAIKIAKEQRKERNRLKKNAAGNRAVECDRSNYDNGQPSMDSERRTMKVDWEDQLTLDAIIRYLRKMKNVQLEAEKTNRRLERKLREQSNELEQLRKENEDLTSRVGEAEVNYETVSEDYKALVRIMERARKLAFLNDDEDDSKPRFKMDANGNLERVE